MRVFLLLFVSLLAIPAFAESDFGIMKSGPAEAAAGTDVTYSVTVIAGGPDAEPVTVFDNIPAGMTFAGISQASGPTFTCNTPPVGDPGAIDCSIASMAAGQQAELLFTFHIPAGTAAGTVFTNIATVVSQTDPNEENNSGATSTTVDAIQSDARVEKIGPTSAGPGTQVTYTIEVGNGGPDDAATLSFDDTLPGTMTFVSLEQTSGPTLSCSTPAIGAGGTISCTAEPFPAGGTAMLTLIGEVPAGTPSGTEFTNTAVVTAPNDPNEENNVSTTTLVVSAVDLSVTKSGPASSNAGAPLAYTLLFANNGPDFADTAVLTDVLPDGTTLVSFDQTAGATIASCSTPEIGFGGTITCTIGFFPGGTDYSFSLQIDPGTNSSVTNTASVASQSFDTDNSNDTSSTTATIVPVADLGVTKTGAAIATAGTSYTYTITVTNDGPSAATDVSLSDAIPSNATFVSVTQTSGPTFACSGTSTVTCTIASLAAGDPATFELVVAVPASASGALSNAATISSSTLDTNGNNASSTLETPIAASADVSIVKSGPATIAAGTDISWTLTATNLGPSDAATVSITDTLPSNTSFVSFTQDSGPTFTCSGTTTVTCDLATFAAGATATFTLVAHVGADATGTLENSASISTTTADPESGNDSSSTTATIAESADLAIEKSAAVSITAGTNLTYTLSVANDGPSDATGVSITDTLPADTTFVSITQTTGPSFNCSGTSTVTCSIATFANGATATFDLVVTVAPTATGTISNTATIEPVATDPDSDDNTSTEVTNVVAEADLEVAKSAPATVVAGQNLTFTLTVTNNGASDAAGVSLTDTLPAGTTFVSVTQTAGPTFDCSGTATVTCSIASLAAGASASFDLVATVASSATGTLSNDATVTAMTADPASENDSATSTTAVTQQADLRIVKSGPASVTAGTLQGYVISLTNAGHSDAANVSFTDVLPPGTTFVSLTQNTGPAFTCTTGPTVTCSIASFPPDTATFVLGVRVLSSATGTITNSVTVTSTTTDPAPGNEVSTTSATVNTLANVAVTKAVPSAVTAGSNATYTITVVNNGPSDAATVTLSDTLPPQTTFVSLTQTGGPAFICTTGATIQCSIATLPVSAPATFDLVVNVDADATGTISNTATIASPTDVTPTNNTSTGISTVGMTADVAVTKTAPASVTAGLNVTYTITVTNGGPSDAQTLTLTDVLPPDTTFVSLTQTAGPTFTCTEGATVTCTIATFASGATASFDLVANVAPSASGTIANSATIESSTDSTPANNSSTATSTVDVAADVTVTKSAPATITAGADATFTITVANNGPSDAPAVTLEDVLPPDTTFVSLAQTGGTTFTCTTGATVTCSVPSLPAGTTATFELVIRTEPDASGTISNTATVSSPGDSTPANDSATASPGIATSADLSVSKSVPAAATAGATTTYTLTVTNAGPSDATAVSLEDILPAGTTFVSLTQTAGPVFTCVTGPTVTCTLATLAPATPATFELVVAIAANATGTIDNTATVSAATSDPEPANNTSTATFAIGQTADLGVTKSGSPAVTAGANATYTIEVSNAGPSDAVNAVLTDTLPAGTTFVSFTQTAGPSFNCSGTSTVTCSIAMLSAGASATFELVVAVDPSAAGTVTNSASITSDTPDTNGSNDSAGASTVVDPGPTDLSITKTANDTQFTAGSTAVYTIVVTNAGPGTAAATTVTDVLPPGTTLNSSTATQGSCTGTTTVTCNLGTLLPGATATITLNVTLPSESGLITNTASVSALNADTDPANNTSSVPILLAASAGIPALSPLALAALAAALAAAAVVAMKR